MAESSSSSSEDWWSSAEEETAAGAPRIEVAALLCATAAAGLAALHVVWMAVAEIFAATGMDL